MVPWKKNRVMSKGIVMGFLIILLTSINMMVVPIDKAEIEGIKSGKAEFTMNANSGQIIIYVNSTIFGALNSSLTQFSADLQAAGYQVVFRNWSATGPRFFDAMNLKQDINSYYTASMAGVIFVGKMPYREYELLGLGLIPCCDLYFMDLDGNWTDTNFNSYFDSHTAGTGDRDAEIWVGRIDPSPMNTGGDIGAIMSYFAKNHQYRTINLRRPDSALLYIDDDWSIWTNEWLGEVVHAYSNVTVMAVNASTNDVNYEKELLNQYEWVHLFVHSYWNQHEFHTGGTVAGYTSWNEIRGKNTQALFYLLFACSACDFSQIQNIGTEYLFTGNTLGVIGSSSPGGMFEPSQFYEPVGNGACLGTGLVDWFSNCTLGSSGLNNPQNSYGMVILGDPSLLIKYGPFSAPPTLFNPGSIGKNVQLFWTSIPDAAIYYIYRNASPISDVTALNPVGWVDQMQNQYLDIVPTDGTYYYVVTAGNPYTNSSISNCVNVTVTSSGTGGIPSFGFVITAFALLISVIGALWVNSRKQLSAPKISFSFFLYF